MNRDSPQTPPQIDRPLHLCTFKDTDPMGR